MAFPSPNDAIPLFKNLYLFTNYYFMREERVTFRDAYSKETKRKGSFYIYDLYGSPSRIGKFEHVQVDNKTGDPYWHVKRYRMDILFRVRAAYEEEGETFIFHYWVNNLPISYNRYSRNRALVFSYIAYLFNMEYPYMRIRSIKEERIIVNDNMYLVKIRKQVVSDLRQENATEALSQLDDIT